MRTLQEFPEIVNGLIKNKLMILSKEVRSGAGAASLEALISLWTSTGAGQVVTLADGSEGQIKIFIHNTDGGELVITPANFAGASSATVTSVTSGDCIAFVFLEGSWWLLWSTANVEGTPLVIA